MNYSELLEHSYAVENEESDNGEISRLEYLADHIFDFTTYDSAMSELFASKAVEVCAAITDRSTFDYIRSADSYRWYLLMCNMPFFAGRIEWGTSVRGAWWAPSKGSQIELQSCGLWIGNEQITGTMRFSVDEWKLFILAVIEFEMA